MEGQVGEKGQVIAGLWGSSGGAEPGVGWEAACPRWVGESGGGGCGQVSGLLPH